jgi:hypothetical protein
MKQDDLMAALEDIVHAGKARRIGISSAGRDVSIVATQAPPILSVLQYPAAGIESWPASFSEDRWRIANHIFGGAVLANKLLGIFTAMGSDLSIDAALREKLLGEPSERVAEFCFARTIRASQPQVIVTSMLQPNHLRANIVGIASTRFSAEDTLTIERYIATRNLLD